jgi:hypothetical protein
MGLGPLNPPYEMINASELHLTAQVEVFQADQQERLNALQTRFIDINMTKLKLWALPHLE